MHNAIKELQPKDNAVDEQIYDTLFPMAEHETQKTLGKGSSSRQCFVFRSVHQNRMLRRYRPRLAVQGPGASRASVRHPTEAEARSAQSLGRLHDHVENLAAAPAARCAKRTEAANACGTSYIIWLHSCMHV